MPHPRLAKAVCLLLAGSVLAGSFQDPAKGSHELVYRFEIEQAIARGELDAKTDVEALMQESLRLFERRMEPQPPGMKISLRGHNEIVVEVPASAAAALPEIKRSVAPDSPSLALSLGGIGELESRRGDLPAAIGHLRDANRVSRTFSSPPDQESEDAETAQYERARLRSRM